MNNMIYRFSDLFQWTSGKGMDRVEGKFPLYGSNGIIGSSDSAPYNNRIILGRVGAYCGSVEYEPNDFDATDNTLITTCDTDKIDYLYASYLLKEYNLNSFAGGAAQPVITQGILKHLKCDIPNLGTQKRIADILYSYDILIELNNKRIKLLEQTAQEIYKEWFVRFRFPGYEKTKFVQGIPDGWEYKKFSEICSFLRGISYSSDEIEEENSPYYLINLKNLRDYGGFRKENTKPYNGKIKSDLIVKKNDLVMAITEMVQERRIIGYVGLIPSYEKECIISADLIKITSHIDNVFLYALFTYGGASQCFSQYGNGTNVIHLKPSAIKNVKMLIPTNSLIDEYTLIAKDCFDRIDILQKQNEILVKQRDYLLPRLMSGKIKLQDNE